MQQKKFIIITLLLFCFNFFFSFTIKAQSSSQKKVLFTELLDSVSKKYNVFFTYNSKRFKNKRVNFSNLDHQSLKEVLIQLEKHTSCSFEDLGNNYFVISQKKSEYKTTITNHKITEKSLQLEEVVITGNRTKPRTILNSPIPIDNIHPEEFKTSGKRKLNRILTFKVPSFNSQNQSISDATAHYDPADLRGLGPSRVLILINGKRKSQSAQVYLNRTPGKGEVGVDLSSIPITAISRIEILRDGASAQYGSDAIAGVINIILKKNIEYSNLNTNIGVTSQNDGFNIITDFNTSFKTGNNGFINLSLEYYNQKFTNRAGSPGTNDLPLNPLPNWVKWAKENSNLGMRVGQPDMEKNNIFLNQEQNIGKDILLYSFHGFTRRTGRSFAFYRAPYWRQNDVGDLAFFTNPEDFIGYQPTFETKIKDFTNTLGLKFSISDSWDVDTSFSHGVNDVFYTVNNSVNRDYLKDFGTSPTSFNPGGYKLTNSIGNIDITGILTNKVSLAMGLEYKIEKFKSYQGDSFSFYKSGSDSFAGIKPSEAGNWKRNNVAGYFQFDYDIRNDFLISLASRYEDFSDFGSNFSWKLNSRYKLSNKGVVRISYSTGFRAPTLHQRHLTSSQYIHTTNSPTPILQRTLSNDNPAVKSLGIPNLFAETSKNLSAGFTYKIDKNLSASVDFYRIRVNNRILFSSQIGYKNGSESNITNPVEQILKDNNVSAIQFFINAGDTKTTGADIILNYENIKLSNYDKLSISLASNFNITTLNSVNTPGILANSGYNIFDRQEQGLITNSRPKSKIILGLNYQSKNWNAFLNNTRFGEVIVTAPESGGVDQKLTAKISTDLGLEYKITKKISLNGVINNIFNVYPDKTLKSTNTTEAGNRFIYSSEIQQLGQLGTNFNIGLNYLF